MSLKKIFGIAIWLTIGCKETKVPPKKITINNIKTSTALAEKLAKIMNDDVANYKQYLTNNDSCKLWQADTNTIMCLIMPNTYLVANGTSAKKVLQKIITESATYWTANRTKKAKQLGLTTNQIVVLASIVEEETNNADDKGKIASVYINRLKKNMKLEADPTLKFALKDFGLKRVLNIHKTLAAASPYSTYANFGLPPGPICIPEISTIDAVLNAPSTEYIFFVAQPNNSGLSNFATDYKQHQLYATEYQNYLNKIGIEKKRTSTPTLP